MNSAIWPSIYTYKQSPVLNRIQYIISGNYRNTFTKQNVSKPVWYRRISPSVRANTYKYRVINTNKNWSNFVSGSPSLPAICSCFLLCACESLLVSFLFLCEIFTSWYKLVAEATEPRHTTKHGCSWCQMWLSPGFIPLSLMAEENHSSLEI